MSILDTALSFIAPHYCVLCDAEGAVLCTLCAASLSVAARDCYRCERPAEAGVVCGSCQLTGPLAGVYAAAAYKGTARIVVRRLKYERAQAAAKDMAALMAARCTLPKKDYIVVAAPTASRRIRQRGYDQASLLARALGRQLHFPTATVLQRLTAHRQVGQTREARRKQMQDAFAVRHSTVVKNARILLVDDVMTTGATLDAAATVLLQAGASSVAAAVFARA